MKDKKPASRFHEGTALSDIQLSQHCHTMSGSAFGIATRKASFMPDTECLLVMQIIAIKDEKTKTNLQESPPSLSLSLSLARSLNASMFVY